MLRAPRAAAMSAIGALVAGTIGALAPTLAAEPAAAAATVPFSCTTNEDGYLLQDTTSALYAVNLISGESEQLYSLEQSETNAAGYNMLDDFIYASRQNGELYRIGRDGIENLGMIPGLPENKRVVGDIDPDGHYWTIAENRWYEIDLAPGSADYMGIVSEGPVVNPGGGLIEGPDWAWVPGGGDYLYRVMTDAADDAHLVAFSMADGTQTDRGVIPQIPADLAIKAGAVYADADGYLYASDNFSGQIFRIDVQTNQADLFADGPQSGANDGARCAQSALRLDFGDAPNRFGTGIGVNGPRHGLVDYDETAHTSALMLGTTADAEINAHMNGDATGDDITETDDEDGLRSDQELVRDRPSTVTVQVTNDTDQPAVLAGWVDGDGNGEFGDDEGARLTVPAASGTSDYALTLPAVTTTDPSVYARFRVFSDGAVIAPTGPAGAGEVEDYEMTLLDRALEVAKTSTATADTRYGDTVSYTVTVRNTGDTAYTDADPAVVYDDLSGVLDDAAYNDDATGGAVFQDPALRWAGALPIGGEASFTYSVTLSAAGDGVIRNVAWAPANPPGAGDPPPSAPDCDAPVDGHDDVTGEACATTSTDLPRLTVSKTSDIDELPASGGTVTFTVTVTNPGPGDYTDAAPASVSDDLSGVLDDAAFGAILEPAAAAFDAQAQRLSWSGPLASGASLQIRYTAVYPQGGAGGDQSLINEACIPQSQTDGDACTAVTVPAAALVMTKSVDPSSGMGVDVGEQVTYTLRFESRGTAAAAVDAADDLSDVLDDATFGGIDADAGLTAQRDGDRLDITGTIPAGQVREVSYTVTVKPFAEQGDHLLGNVLSYADGSCPTAGCPQTENPVRHFTVTKTSDASADVVPGDVVEYTVQVISDGEAPYSVGNPAGFTDDLSDVLDDADYNGDVAATSTSSGAVPAPTVSDGALAWSGPLLPGATVTVTYSVTVTDNGDHRLRNAAVPVCADGVPCDPPTPPVDTPLPYIVADKSVDPASGSVVSPGQTVTYTLTFENGGQAAGAVDSTDDLSGVLDDTELVDGPTVDDDHAAAITAAFDAAAESIRVTGELAAGQTATVTYRMTIRPIDEQGDSVMRNVLTQDVPPTSDCPLCPEFPPPTTQNPIAHFSVDKSADRTVDVVAGDVVTYTVTVVNDGGAPYPASVPAGFTDDLSDVLDDADYNGDAAASSSAGADVAAPAVADGVLSWSGPLAVDERVTITYSVTVTNRGDHRMVNTAVPVCADGVDCDPATPPVEVPLAYITPFKTSDPEPGTGVEDGDVVTYTLSFVNSGQATGPVDAVDDLAEVLDDAALTGQPEVDADHAGTVSAAFDEGAAEIRVAGPLAAGETATVTYQVTIAPHGERGDNVIRNVLTPDRPPFVPGPDCVEDCDPFEPPSTEHPVGDLVVEKSSDPVSGSTVRPGARIVYTLTFRSVGEGPVTVDREDVLTDVLDDAVITGAPVASVPELSVSDIVDDRFSVTGELGPDVVATVVYTATVNQDGERGDDRIANAVVPAGDDPAETCEPGAVDCTVNYVSDVQVAKSVDPEDGTVVDPGQTLTYTLSFDNVGVEPQAAPVEVDYTDVLDGVLDDAELIGQPEASDPSLTIAVDDDGIRLTGALATGQHVDVVYSVRVKAYGQQGDHVLDNVIAITGEEPICAADSPLCTSNPVTEPPALAGTGGRIPWPAVIGAVLLLVVGGALRLRRRVPRD